MSAETTNRPATHDAVTEAWANVRWTRSELRKAIDAVRVANLNVALNLDRHIYKLYDANIAANLARNEYDTLRAQVSP